MSDPTPYLDGEHVRLQPYWRGAYGRAYLYRLWQLAESAGSADPLFYAQACPHESWRGDLVGFVTHFSCPTRHLLVVCHQGTGTPCGLVWFDQVPGQPSGLIGLWYPRHRTRLAREGTALATQYAFHVLGYPRLCGWTPHRTALRHGLALGWRHETTLPGFVQIGGEARDMYVLVKERDDRGESARPGA